MLNEKELSMVSGSNIFGDAWDWACDNPVKSGLIVMSVAATVVTAGVYGPEAFATIAAMRAGSAAAVETAAVASPVFEDAMTGASGWIMT